MKQQLITQFTLALSLAALAAGCTPEETPKATQPAPEKKRVELGKNVYFENEGEARRVVLPGKVVLRDGQLEGLLTRSGTKEHEYILAVDADARTIHAALLAAKAKPGKPVQFEPKYVPATGSEIKVTLRYKKDKETITVPAQQWIRLSERQQTVGQQLGVRRQRGSARLPRQDEDHLFGEPGRLHLRVQHGRSDARSPRRQPEISGRPRLRCQHRKDIPPLGTGRRRGSILEVVPEKK